MSKKYYSQEKINYVSTCQYAYIEASEIDDILDMKINIVGYVKLAWECDNEEFETPLAFRDLILDRKPTSEWINDKSDKEYLAVLFLEDLDREQELESSDNIRVLVNTRDCEIANWYLKIDI